MSAASDLSLPFYERDICYFSPNGASLLLLDQTLLPAEERYIAVQSAEQVAEAIYKLRVRGAPLIGIAAAMGLCVALQKAGDIAAFAVAKQTIGSSRPTAVNLAWALQRMETVYLRYLQTPAPHSLSTLLPLLREEALLIKREEAQRCEAIGTYGSALITPGMGILTHCNAGALATGSYGTATAPIYFAHRQGKAPQVFADETRPLLQGARLTAYELQRSGVDITLLCDNMAASLMNSGKVQMMLVGCDRVARNGDTANKIGTYGVAVLAHHFGIPVYVCGPTSSMDGTALTGHDIVIEQRPAGEVSSLWYRHPMAPQGCKVMNPSFDVTPHELITGYITERGILQAHELFADGE